MKLIAAHASPTALQCWPLTPMQTLMQKNVNWTFQTFFLTLFRLGERFILSILH